jgi:prefoldin subunit 5
MKNTEKIIKEAAASLGTEPEQLIATITKFKKETEELEREIASLQKQLR